MCICSKHVLIKRALMKRVTPSLWTYNINTARCTSKPYCLLLKTVKWKIRYHLRRHRSCSSFSWLCCWQAWFPETPGETGAGGGPPQWGLFRRSFGATGHFLEQQSDWLYKQTCNVRAFHWERNKQMFLPRILFVTRSVSILNKAPGFENFLNNPISEIRSWNITTLQCYNGIPKIFEQSDAMSKI